MHALVTGGASFIGRWLCDVLVKAGAKVICLDNFLTGLNENIKHLLNEKDFKLIKQNVDPSTTPLESLTSSCT